MIPPITTKRLRLESLSKDFLKAIVENDLDKGRDLVAFRISSGTSMLGKIWVSRRLEMILEDKLQHPWMYRGIIREKDNEMIGFISFHHKFPDPDLAEFSKHGVELGYTIESDYRRSGYARESILGMIEWAKNQQEGIEVFVTISPENHPSMNLAESMGFLKVGEHEDELDGLEFVMKYPDE